MQRKPGDWDCPECQTLNFASRTECLKCKCFKSKTKQPVSKKKGDWNCNCGELNFASRTSCRKCNNTPQRPHQPHKPVEPKPSDSIPNKPVNLISIKPGDWTCESCQTNNFGNRTNCFNCGKDRNKQIEEKEDELCGVCLASPTDTCITVCGHLFCNFCALNCTKCPKCRKDYNAGNLIKIYK